VDDEVPQYCGEFGARYFIEIHCILLTVRLSHTAGVTALTFIFSRWQQ
jgi:hypothetical protein